MNEHLAPDPGHAGDSSLGFEHVLNTVSSTSSPCAPPEPGSTLSARLRRQKVKVITALKSLTNSSAEQAKAGQQSNTSVDGHGTKSTVIPATHKMSAAIFRPPFETTIVRRSSPKGRPLLKETFQDAGISQLSHSGSSGAIGTPASNISTSNMSTPSSNSTFSTDRAVPGSMFRNKDPNTLGRDGPTNCPPTTPSSSRTTTTRRSPLSHNRNEMEYQTPPATAPALRPRPSIVTVERAAAAKVFLETHFGSLLAPGPSPRQMRQQMLETELFNRARRRREGGLDGAEAARAQFCRRETEYLREVRAMKARGIKLLSGSTCRSQMDGGGSSRTVVEKGQGRYETVKVLGKGSFGVVKLVRERGRRRSCQGGKVYAMKVIRKSKMLKTSQEGHLRAERDLLVASEGSRWIVPLVASFQDLSNLYLVMEYMPGGDFLSLLIRENVLSESVARFYVAEIVLCVEAAHSLKCIHRDIKPDNFLISTSGHLKISDFGLAFDGHWSHDTAYYNSHRDGTRSHENKKWASGIAASIEKHEKKDLYDGEPLLSWRNRCGTRHSARSVVGTSQYMAPEVIEGRRYDARCDWWSVGIILFECIYGHTPFLSEEGRHQTKENILRHHETFGFPPRPTVSRRCQHLMLSLITDKEYRLCSERYRMRDLMASSSSASSSGVASKMRDFAGRYVFPYDAEDIKAHKWFRNIPWDRLHELEPPLVPQLRSVDDTHYFEDGGSVSDGSESESDADGGQMQDAHDSAAEQVPHEALLASPASSTQGPICWSLPATCYQNPATLEQQQQQQQQQLPHLYHDGYFTNLVSGGTTTATTTATNHEQPFSPVFLPSLESPLSTATPIAHFPPTPTPAPLHATSTTTVSPTQEQLAFLRPLRYTLQTLALTVLATPWRPPLPSSQRDVDGGVRVGDVVEEKLRVLETWLAQLRGDEEGAEVVSEAERMHLREFVRRFAVTYGRGGGGGGYEDWGGQGEKKEQDKRRRDKERRRPRDRLLRDETTKAVAMEVRRRMAFSGYEWTRMRSESDDDDYDDVVDEAREEGVGSNESAGSMEGDDDDENAVDVQGVGADNRSAGPGRETGRVMGGPGVQQQGRSRFRGWGDDAAVVRAMYSGPWSLR
ncbi:hypothetical protein C7999DRAFT_11015 [Corynascus novoguineensis]|uniref:non-specific serine/threonine protein kinase n=1 Tax=Corynascus novoguineensis TaxID=1126955 RepID=A0AAN7D0H8_9PEZI|nr:hypothetical protein C7999DRAFT_11015 [Corynascus novoguineensis]